MVINMSEQNNLPNLVLETGEETLKTELSVELSSVPEPKEVSVPTQTQLTPEELKLVNEFAEKIDLTNSNMVLMYGAAAQKSIADFSDTALATVKTKETGEVGEMLTDLVAELKGFNEGVEKKGLFGSVKKQAKKLSTLKAKYDTISVNVDKICDNLEGHQMSLLKDISVMEHLFDENSKYFKEITLYIAAGEKKLAEVREVDLKALTDKAQETGDAMDVQKANDLANMCGRFEKKLYDLKLTRQVSIQMAPQIRMLQNNNSVLVERIQSTMVNTIPLWKNQMLLALGLDHSHQAMQAQHEVTEMTNTLLKKNAEKLKQGTIEVATEAERGIIEIDTLRQTNQLLIETLDEVIKIQKEGQAQRTSAEKELAEIEGQLKKKIMEIRG